VPAVLQADGGPDDGGRVRDQVLSGPPPKPVGSLVLERFLAATYAELPVSTPLDSTVLRDEKIRYTFSGVRLRENINVLRVQDIMVRDIIMTNRWERPVYFAVTVSPDSKIGLDSYLWMDGQAYEFKPIKSDIPEGALDVRTMSANVLARDVVPSTEPQNGFLYRELNNPDVFYNENQQRMALNYRAGFMRLADYASRYGNATWCT